jgi:tRNA(Leu) C34 or U34 (ribose-2'-O)-methylase TrmL
MTLLYLIMNGLRKNNVSTLLRSCAAFNAVAVLCGALAQIPLQQLRMADHGSAQFVTILRFARLADAVAHLRALNVHVCGVEIHPTAVAVDSTSVAPFRPGATALLLGCEGDGLSEQQMALCDHFVYIPHYGNGTASLNVAIAGSICMHRFASWAQFKEREIDPECAHKFLVDRAQVVARQTAEGDDIRRDRAAAREQLESGDSVVVDVDTLLLQASEIGGGAGIAVDEQR